MLGNEEACNKNLISDWCVSQIGKKYKITDEEHKGYSKWNLSNETRSQLTLRVKQTTDVGSILERTEF